MKNYLSRAAEFAFSIKKYFFLLCLMGGVKVHAQQVVVLPSNGAHSQQISPQGSMRQQRAFYLITPQEMQTSGIQNSTILKSIGFTLGSPQSFSTQGAFKVYLQNTIDRNSRRDIGWKDTTVSGTTLRLDSLGQGQYEWRVQARCGTSNSLFSDTVQFSTNAEDTCKAPSSLFTSNITTTGATLNWVASAYPILGYTILYKNIISPTWIDTVIVTAPAGSYTISGLSADSSYEWRIKSNCGDTSSSGVGTVFTTLHVPSSQCNAITSPTVSATFQDSAVLTWTDNQVGYYNYQIEYRIKGRDTWNGVISINNTAKLSMLNAATDYQWRIKKICSDSSSNYVDGPDFKTTGSPDSCYAPRNLEADSVTSTTAILKWDPVEYSNEYIVSYRLKESISWENAINGMSNVHNDSLNIPSVNGRYNILFANGTTADFTYSGEGLYVAWEYSRDTGSLPLPNITMGTDRVDSLGLIQAVYTSFIAKDTGLFVPLFLTSTSVRPETSFGSNQLSDSVSVAAVFALGATAPNYSKDTIKAIINNFETTAKDYQVKLTVKNANGVQRYTADSTVNIAANGTAEVLFAGWQPTELEVDSIIISIPAEPGENVINNNRRYYIQEVTSNRVTFADSSSAFSSAGFGNLDGLILSKHYFGGCGAINSANIYLDPSAVGKQVYAVVVNDTGAIVTQSEIVTVTDEATNNYYPFYFSSPVPVQNKAYYIGLAQTQNVIAYNPVGVQWETDSIRGGAYYRANLDASNLREEKLPGRLMIEALLTPLNSTVNIDGKLSLCTSGSINTLKAIKTEARFANKVLDKSGELGNLQFGAVQALGTPDVYPNHGFNAKSWIAANIAATRKYLTLKFPNPAAINFIDIYETLNPGSIDTVYVKDPGTGLYVNVFDTTGTFTNTLANKMRIKIPLTSFDVDEVRLALSFDSLRNYNAIDAVAIGVITDPADFTSYLWSPGGQTTDSIDVSSPGVYNVKVTTADGCTSVDSVTVYQPSSNPPVISVQYISLDSTFNGVVGSFSICTGDSVRLISSKPYGNMWSTGATTQEIVVSTAGTYTVSHDDGSGCGSTGSDPVVVTVNTSTPVSISGALNICPGYSTVLDAGSGFNKYLWNTGETTQTISVNAASTIFVRAVDNNGCVSSASVVTTYATLPPPTITGTLTFCPGSSTILNAGSGYTNYHWSTGETTPSIVVTTGNTYSVTVTNGGGCTSSASVVTTLFVPQTPSISGISGFCAGNSTTLTASPGYSAYSWSNGQTTQSINVSAAGIYTVNVTDNNSCAASKSITVNQFPNPVPVITGTLTFCGGTSTTLNAGPGYSSYLWNTQETTQTIDVSNVGTFWVTVTNTNGCQATSAIVNTSTTGAIPASPGPITGPSTASCNTTANNYSITAVSNTSHYVWTVPSGATITSGQGASSISVNYGASFRGGYIVVAASNACGQSPTITERHLFVQALPNAPGPITGESSNLCGPVTKTYSISPVSSASSYSWSVPTGATIQSGQGTTSINVLFNTGFTNGNICVLANNVCGGTTPSCLLVSGVPATPGAISGPTSVCKNQSGINYQIDPVPGATSYTWTVPQSASVSFGQGTRSILVKVGSNNGLVTVRANNACATSAVRSLAITVTATCFTGGEPTYTMQEIRPVPEVISSYGGSANAAGNYLEWTLGEPRVESVLKTDYLFTQGFHQPLIHIIPVKKSDTLASDNIKIVVYPNPVSSVVTVKIETSDTKAMVLELVDVNSRLLQRKNIMAGLRNNLAEFLMTGYSGGSYYLIVRDTKGAIINTTKLVKLN